MTHNVQAFAVVDRGSEEVEVLAEQAPHLRVVCDSPPSAARHNFVFVPYAVFDEPAERPRGFLAALWQRFFGRPHVEVRDSTAEFGVVRAMYEIGSDYLPSSGTWPVP